MNKKIIVFICILSLLVPFLPQFDFVVRASVPDDESLSSSENFAQWIDDNFYTDSFGSLRPKSQAPLYLKVNWALTDAGYVLKDPVSAVVDSLQSATNLQLLTKENLMDYGQSINYDYSSLSQNIVNNTITYAVSNVPYFIRSTINISDLFSAMYPYGAYDSANWQSQFNQLKTFINASGGPYITALYFDGGNLGWSSVFCYRLEKDFFKDDLQFYLYNSSYDSVFFDNLYGIFNAGEGNPLHTATPNYLGLFSNGSVNNSLSCDGVRIIGSNIGSLQTYYLNYGSLGYGLLKYIRTNTSTFATGSVFVVPDGFDNYEFPIFKNLTELQGFSSGNSLVYKFNSNVSIPEGADIDYSRLYDIISTEVSHSSVNVIQSINNVADNYLQQQIDLLHDINNALNDGSGQSWLRRIYDLLDYNFPLTLQAFEDLKVAIQNISISGGGSDLTHINRVLDEINGKLGFMIEEPLTDADVEDMEDLKNLAQQKFPFCVFSDIVAISVILNQTPEQPHWQIPLKLPGSSSANNIEVDLSWYEEVRDLVQGVFIFIFIVGLLALSVKIFSALKS